MEKYVTYPPKGKLPLPSKALNNGTQDIRNECQAWHDVRLEAYGPNPTFNVYRVLDAWPVLWDVLGFPGSFANVQVSSQPRMIPYSPLLNSCLISCLHRTQSPIYFARKDVQKVIHAPHINWTECAIDKPYVNGIDTSIPSMLSVMPYVIEKSKRTVVMHGGTDFVLIADGTRIAIQSVYDFLSLVAAH